MQIDTEKLRLSALAAQQIAPGPWECGVYQSDSVTVLFSKPPHENRYGPHWFGASVTHYNITEAGVSEEQANREKATVGIYLRQVSPNVLLALLARAEAAENDLFTLRNRAGCGPDQSGPDVWDQRDAAIAERDRLAEALGFYACECAAHGDDCDGQHDAVYCGWRAKAALASIKKGPPNGKCSHVHSG